MNFKKFHESKNLFDKSKKTDNSRVVYTTGEIDVLYGVFVSDFTPIEPNTTYTLNIVSNISSKTGYLFALYDENKNFVNTGPHEATSATVYTFTTPSNVAYIRFNGNMTSVDGTMLNVGSTPLPYEPYGNTWIDISYYQHKTATDTLTLPTVLYPNDTTATVGLKGNTIQNGTPSPDNPIQPQGCGDLETVGAKAGQYKIPISSASTTTPVYLGEVETTRKIKKLVLTGEENITQHSVQNDIVGVRIPTPSSVLGTSIVICSHYEGVLWPVYNGYRRYGIVASNPSSGNAIVYMSAPDSEHNTLSAFVQWIKDQYAAGTPVTIWYVLATPTTGIVNEPLRKIGDYADTVSGITIPTIAGANTLSVDTTLQPSEVTVNYKGWHPVSSVHERESGAWT